jgi:flagellar biosynthesis protein FliR
MLTFTEAQLLSWISPLLWPFLRALALFSAMPVLGTRTVPARVRIGLAALISLAAQASLPEMPQVDLASAQAFMMVVQQVVVGLLLGFSVRVVFAAVEFAGELVGLQMGLNFAGFFDPISASQGTASARFFGTLVAWVFVVANGHLLVLGALVHSFEVVAVAPEPLAFLRQVAPWRWGAEVFATGLWIALPMVAMVLFVNLLMGVVSRVAPQINVFAVGFPVTLGMGLLGMMLTLPWMQAPFTVALERMLSHF